MFPRVFEFCPAATFFSRSAFQSFHFLRAIINLLGFFGIACLFSLCPAFTTMQIVWCLIYIICLHFVYVLFPAWADAYTDLIFFKHKAGDEKNAQYKARRKIRLLLFKKMIAVKTIVFYCTAIGIASAIFSIVPIVRTIISSSLNYVTLVLGILFSAVSIIGTVLLRRLLKKVLKHDQTIARCSLLSEELLLTPIKIMQENTVE